MKLNLCLLLSFLLILGSCAGGKANRNREGDNKGQETQMTVADEKKMTEEVLPQMRKDYPAVQDPALQKYISQLGMKLVKASNLEGNPYNYNFTVVDVDYVNAFALPAGTVFVTAPLIAMAENEAELSGVIGHEVGHVIARHTAERMEEAKKSQTRNILTTAGVGVLTGIGGYAIGSKVCKGDKMCMAKATLAGGALGAGGTLLVQKYFFMKNSREDEMEADRIGFRIATKAGYDKNAVGTFYEKLLKMEKERQGGKDNAFMKSLSDAMSTHPPSDERVAQMQEMANQSPMSKGVMNTKSFENAKSEVQTLMASKKK